MSERTPFVDDPTPDGAVVAAIDGSERDPAVLDWAGRHAATYGRPLHLVHVLDLGTPLSAYGEVMASPDLVDTIERECVEAIEAARERLRGAHPGLPTSAAMPTGSPAGALLQAVEGASLVVVGSQHQGASERSIGSTTISVAAHSPVPVVVIPEGYQLGEGRLVVGIDGSDCAAQALELVVDLAARTGQDVLAVATWFAEVVHGVVVTEEGTLEWEEVSGRYRAMVERALTTVRETHPDVPITIETRRGSAAATLVAAAEGAELLAVGSRGRGGFGGLMLGSVSQRVLASATTPVLVVRHRD